MRGIPTSASGSFMHEAPRQAAADRCVPLSVNRPPVRRLLFLLPFPPRLDASHGGSRAMAQSLVGLADHHRVGVLCLRAPGEPPIDPLLRERCALVEEVLRPPPEPTAAQRWLRRARLLCALTRGRPMWASDWAVGAFARRAQSVADSWRPDVVQIEYHVMGQYAVALTRCPAPRVLVEYDPGVEAARQQLRAQRGLRRLLHALDLWAWTRFERAALRQVDAAVVFTERDQRAIERLACAPRVVRIPLGTVLPAHTLNPRGALPPRLLFVGNFTHAPNVDAAIRLI